MNYSPYKNCIECNRLMSADDAHRRCQKCRPYGSYSQKKKRRYNLRRWLPADLAFLRDHYSQHGPTWIGERIGRPASQVKKQASRIGITRAALRGEGE